MAAWQPQQQGVAQIADLLLGGSSVDNEVQRRVQQEIQHLATTVPEFPCYLAYILSAKNDQPPSLRAMAGYALKAYLMVHQQQIQPPALAYVKQSLLDTIGDKDESVNRVTGTVIAQLFSQLKVQNWPEAMLRLVECISDPNHASFFSALSTVQKICEDDADDLIQSQSQPLTVVLPKLIGLVSHPSDKIAVVAIRCISELVHADTQVVEQSFDEFLRVLFSRAMDQSHDLRKAVCFCIVKLLEYRPEKLEPQLDEVIKYMIMCTQDTDEAIALEACEFWLVIAEHTIYNEVLVTFLPQIIPTLLSRMNYSQEELDELGGDEEDTHIPDNVQDLKPRHYRGKSHDVSSSTGVKSEESDVGNTDTDDASDISLDEDDDDEAVNQWTLRKCSAAALDVISNVYRQSILETLLPLLRDRLQSDNWLVRESGILALGAIAEGCMDGVTVHLPQLVPYLLTSLNDRPLVRSIACWTLGRYAAWIVYEQGTEFFTPLVQGLLQNCTHGNKKVQEASCSALATLEETAGLHILPFLPAILNTVISCFGIYQQRNLLVLYDCIGTLAEVVGAELNKPEYINVLLPALLQKWHGLPDDHKDLLPLFECLASVIIALGLGFSGHSKEVFERCIRIVQTTYNAVKEYDQNPAGEEPDKDFYIVALDLMAGVVQGLGPSSESLVSMYQNEVMSCLNVTLGDPQPAVKQSALGLFGDLVVNCYVHVKPFSQQLLANAMEYIRMWDEASWLRLCNNAVWVCGELSSKMGADMAQYVPPIAERVLPIFCNQYPREAPQMLMENCALTLGRLGTVGAEVMAKDLERFAGEWCSQVTRVRDSAEKEDAFRGFLQIVRVNPNAMSASLPKLAEALALYQNVTPETNEAFQGVLVAFKNMLGDAQWEQALSTVPPAARDLLRQRFGL